VDWISTTWAQLGAAGTLLAAPDPGQGTPPPGISDKIDTLLSYVAWLAVAAAVAGVLFVAIRMALLHQRGQLGEHMAGLGAVLGACVLIGGASALVGAFV
jgi:hypothetical protein